MKPILNLSIKYIGILTLCLLANFYIIVLSPLNIPEYIPYTPIKSYGLTIAAISILIINLFIRRLIKIGKDITIGYLTAYATIICFCSELLFHCYLAYLYPEDGWLRFITGVCKTSALFAVIAFFVAFQLKTRRTRRLISYIIAFLVIFKLLTYLFPKYFYTT